MNSFRANGVHSVPEREFGILKKIFLKIADHIKNDKDYACTNLLLILSQTFYNEKDGEKIYLDKFLKNHEMFLDLEIFEKLLIEQIEKDIEGLKNTNSQENMKENDVVLDAYKINNVLNSQMIPFCDNMIDFGMSIESIYKIIEPILTKYNANDDLRKIIDDIIKSKQEINIEKNKDI